MKKVLPKILAILIVVLACVCVFAACSSTPKTRADAVVTLLSTNDIHGNVAGDEEAVIGMVKAAEIKASTPNAILIDAGDATQGASFASIGSGADVIKMMNAAEYDVMAAGNHDFDYGTQTLLANAEAASFPILAANVKKDGEDMLPASAIVERAGETGAKVTEVKLADGTVLDRADAQNKILLATNNYVSSSFPNSEKLGELGGEDMLIVDYIKHVANGGVLDYDCAYDRIKIRNDLSPDTYTVTVEVKNADKTACANSQVALTIDGKEQQTLTTDGEGKLTVTLSKGAHYLKLANSTNFVYVNNYSGTGLEYTKDGYYTFAFLLA